MDMGLKRNMKERIGPTSKILESRADKPLCGLLLIIMSILKSNVGIKFWENPNKTRVNLVEKTNIGRMNDDLNLQIAVEGCCHGELDKIYERIRSHELESGTKVDLLLCCGDFQSIRDEADLNDLSCPQKYREYRDFKEYYNCAKSSPVLTVFIGGNHEAPDFLRNLYYGGWVAPNIYYLGHSGVLNVNGLRIAGVSGIYNFHSYTRGYFEAHPYTEETKRSAYHIREFDVKKLNLIKEPVDIFLSHDWPSGIEHYGNLQELLRIKPYFHQDIMSNTLGNPRTRELLDRLRPRFWFSAHLHVKYEAMYAHDNGNFTYFLALDKVLPYREFLRVLSIFPADVNGSTTCDNGSSAHSQTAQNDKGTRNHVKLCYDREWCAILVANKDKMPLNTFPSVQPITLNEPTEENYKFVDNQFSHSGYETVAHGNSTFYSVPYHEGAHLNPKAQREDFMKLLGLPDNNYFSPELNQKFQVNFVE
nr:lariat debranching enzyme [Theileria orientalis]